MTTVSLSQLLLLYTWFVLAALLAILALIGRFFEKFARVATYYRWFALPTLLFGVSTIRLSSIDAHNGDLLADSLSAGGGLLLIVLAYHLYQRMTRGRGRA